METGAKFAGACLSLSKGEARRQFVYGGTYIDEPLIFDKDTDSDGDCVDAGGSSRFFYAQGANFNVVAVTASDGTVVETVTYDPYGEATVTVAGGQSASGSPYLFQGRRWDDEADLYYFRNRSLSPRLGRFLQRDPIGYVDGMTLYAGFRAAPHRFMDPGGLNGEEEGKEEECICGPDVTELLIHLLKYALKWHIAEGRRYKGGRIPAARGLLWMRKWGGFFDWTTERYGTENCPKGEPCDNTYWLLGECVHDHWIGNFMYGLMGRLLSVPDVIMDMAGQHYQGPGEGDPKAKGLRLMVYHDPPWDTAGYELGRIFYEKTVVHKGGHHAAQVGFGEKFLEKALKKNVPQRNNMSLWDQANHTDLKNLFLGAGFFVERRYPTPHAQGYKGVCEECDEELGFRDKQCHGFPVGWEKVRGKTIVELRGFERTDRLK